MTQRPTQPPPEVVAPLRYTVIAPIVSRTLAFGEQRALIAQPVAYQWHWPDGHERPVHPRTLLRWVAAYRTGGLEALKPETRPAGGPRCARTGIALRAEDPHRNTFVSFTFRFYFIFPNKHALRFLPGRAV